MIPVRVIWIVMDSVGIGELADAGHYGDQGSNTVGHVAAAVPLAIPTLRAMGLDRLVAIPAAPDSPSAPAAMAAWAGDVPIGAYGRMAEASPGKDSVTGHWEMTGLVLDRPFPTFPDGFPWSLIDEFERRIRRRSMGNVVGSGTAIIEALGPEHLRTGAPIVYTSADSVFQIAAHEDVIPVPELYAMCGHAFELAARGLGVARVIARPFVGTPGQFTRTANRRDFAIDPVAPTLLDRLKDAGQGVAGVGKIEDLFAGRGLTEAIHTASDAHGMDVVEALLTRMPAGLIFVNLVDFDTEYGHRNDIRGYAANLERCDARLARLLPRLTATDLLVVTADHGNDPSTPSTDHSREHVPVFVVGKAVRPGTDLGTRATFADLGQTVAELFGVPTLAHGTSFLSQIVDGAEVS
jgi:phosphopentomutase